MNAIEGGNLLANIVSSAGNEDISNLLTRPGLRIERIVSTGQASPPGFWYDQEQHEVVVVIAGSAKLRFEQEAAERDLKPGDWLDIPAHCRHRVEWTDPNAATVWLAIHYSAGA
jgi:cupin 2 domain-containing protein